MFLSYRSDQSLESRARCIGATIEDLVLRVCFFFCALFFLQCCLKFSWFLLWFSNISCIILLDLMINSFKSNHLYYCNLIGYVLLTFNSDFRVLRVVNNGVVSIIFSIQTTCLTLCFNTNLFLISKKSVRFWKFFQTLWEVITRKVNFAKKIESIPLIFPNTNKIEFLFLVRSG